MVKKKPRKLNFITTYKLPEDQDKFYKDALIEPKVQPTKKPAPKPRKINFKVKPKKEEEKPKPKKQIKFKVKEKPKPKKVLKPPQPILDAVNPRKRLVPPKKLVKSVKPKPMKEEETPKPKRQKEEKTANQQLSTAKNVKLKFRSIISQAESRKYPVYYLSYVDERIKKEGELKLPEGYLRSVNRTLNMGYFVQTTKLSSDHVVIANKNNYKQKIKEYIATKQPKLAKGARVLWAKHAPYRHFRDFVFPQMKKDLESNKELEGVFLAEADLYIYDGYSFGWFDGIADIAEDGKSKENVWLAWKKILSNYIVGNFFLFFSREGFKKLERFIESKGQKDMLSDRFFYQLYKLGDLKLNNIDKEGEELSKPVRIGDEIEHFSKVAGGVRKSGVK